MEFLVSAKQMKQYDEDTIHKAGIPSAVLMERAALAVVDEMFREGLDLSYVLVVCGSGNNGGDGFAVARLLDEQGIRVRAAFVGNEDSMSEGCRMQKQICENCGIKISSNFREHEYTTIVDAIFGIGLSRPVEGRYGELIGWINQQPGTKVAVDIPSGISADTGAVLNAAVSADLTVTFAYRKLGQIFYPGTEYCGRVVRRDIGITSSFSEGVYRMPKIFTYGEDDLWKIPRRKAYSNKGTYGKVLLIAGSQGMSGAACLCAAAAYRCGCGLVRVFTPECNRQVIQTYLPEAIVTAYADRGAALELLPEALEWSDVAGIGPGLGWEALAGEVLEYVLNWYEKPLVIDADGLNLLSGTMELLEKRRQRTVLTPHIGEMVRLTGKPKEELLENLLEAAGELAGEYHVICALKDARTVVADGGRSFINTSGNSGMAKGGSGDVLTGVICSLLAQGMHPFDAASFGVYLHGLAGDAAARDAGEYSMVAGDIIAHLGEVMRLVGAQNSSGAEESHRKQPSTDKA